jgi:hypothetical protein
MKSLSPELAFREQNKRQYTGGKKVTIKMTEMMQLNPMGHFAIFLTNFMYYQIVFQHL